MPKLNQRGAIQFLVPLILIIGIIAGLYLVQHPQIFKPKAAPNLPSAPETSFELELEKNGIAPFADEATPTNLTTGQTFRVDIYARSDVDAANLFQAKVKYTSDTVDFVSVEQRSGQSFVKNWVDASVDNSNTSVGVVSMVGGVPNPGIKTDSKTGAMLMGSIIFKAKATGTAKIGLSDGNSAIYSNANNINILTATKGIIEVPIQEVQPTPTPTPIAHNVSCTGVVAEGGVVSKLSNGDSVYILESDGKMKLTAQVNSTGTNTAVWIVTGRPTGYPNDPKNGGFFDYPAPGLIVNYTAPKNTTTLNDNLTIESTVTAVFSDGYTASTQCALVRVSVKPVPPKTCPAPPVCKQGEQLIHGDPPPGSTACPIYSCQPTASANRVFVTSTRFNGNLGGLTGADAKCQDRANAANLGGTWKAWLSDSTTSASSRLNHSNSSYVRTDGKVVANNWADLTDGTLQNPIEITELGARLTAPASCSWCAFGFPWTNTNNEGNPIISEANRICNNFTSSAATGDTTSFRQGYAFGTSPSQWTIYPVTSDCNSANELYCFEQPAGAAPPSTSQPGDGDGNKDGKVDLIDLSILLTDFNKTGNFRTGIDLNGDGKINTFDFSLMRNLLIKNGVIKGGNTPPTPTPTAAPTPTSRPEDIGISLTPFPLKMSSYTKGISVNPATITCIISSCNISLYSSTDLPGSGSTYIFGNGVISRGQSVSMGIRTPFADPGVYNTQVTFVNNDTGKRVTIPFEVTILK